MATKKCPFCAEEIQSDAIKCRFCGSMLSGGAAPAGGPSAAGPIVAPPVAPLPPAIGGGGGAEHAINASGIRVLYEGTASWKSFFWSYIGASTTVLVGLILAAYLGIAKVGTDWYSPVLGAVIAVAGVVWFLMEHFKRTGRRVRITTETMDIETGIFGKRIDTIQLWRVKDIDYRQSFMERVLGVSTIHVISQDVENPNLMVRGVIHGRELFTELRDSIALARQSRNVVGMVQ